MIRTFNLAKKVFINSKYNRPTAEQDEESRFFKEMMEIATDRYLADKLVNIDSRLSNLSKIATCQ